MRQQESTLREKITESLMRLKALVSDNQIWIARQLGYERDVFSRLKSDENYQGSPQLLAALEMFLELTELKQNQSLLSREMAARLASDLGPIHTCASIIQNREVEVPAQFYNLVESAESRLELAEQALHEIASGQFKPEFYGKSHYRTRPLPPQSLNDKPNSTAPSLGAKTFSAAAERAQDASPKRRRKP